MAHAKKYAPSAASRWMSCTASPLLIEELLETKKIVIAESTKAASDGTAMHSAGEHILRDDALQAEQVVPGFVCPETQIELDESHVNIVDEYVTLIRKKRDTDGALLHIEERVHLTEDCFGTVDSLLVSPERMRVWDLKTGRVRVMAKKNWQIGIYGAGALKKFEDFYDFKNVELGISQHSIGHVDRTIIDVDELRGIGNEVEDTIDMIENGKGVFVPSNSNCYWCPAKTECPTLRKDKINVAVADFGDVVDDVDLSEKADDLALQIDADKPEDLDWGERLEMVSLVRRWCDSVEERAHKMIFDKEVPEDDSLGEKFKVVTGRPGNRYFEDATKAVNALARKFGLKKKDTHSEPTPKSPSQMKSVIRQTEPGKELKVKEVEEIIDKYTTRNPGSPTVVPADDPREPAGSASAAQEDFADAT